MSSANIRTKSKTHT